MWFRAKYLLSLSTLRKRKKYMAPWFVAGIKVFFLLFRNFLWDANACMIFMYIPEYTDRSLRNHVLQDCGMFVWAYLYIMVFCLFWRPWKGSQRAVLVGKFSSRSLRTPWVHAHKNFTAPDFMNTNYVIIFEMFWHAIQNSNKKIMQEVPPGSPWRPEAAFFPGLACESSPIDVSNCIRNHHQYWLRPFMLGPMIFNCFLFAKIRNIGIWAKVCISPLTGRLLPTAVSAPEPEGADGSWMPPSSRSSSWGLTFPASAAWADPATLGKELELAAACWSWLMFFRWLPVQEGPSVPRFLVELRTIK